MKVSQQKNFATFSLKIAKLIENIFIQFFIIGLYVLIPTIIFVWFLTLPIPTYIQIDFIVERITFRSNKNDFLELLPIGFNSAKVTRFSRIDFYPEKVTDLQNNFLEINNSFVSIEPRGEQYLSAITTEAITTESTCPTVGSLQCFQIMSDTKVALEVTNINEINTDFSLTIERQPLQHSKKYLKVYLRYRTPFSLKAYHCNIKGLEQSINNFNILALSKRNPSLNALKISSQPDDLKFTLKVPSDKPFDILSNNIPVNDLQFMWEDFEDGKRIIKPSLIKKGEISYPDYPILIKKISESRFISLSKEDDYKIVRLYFDQKNKGIRVILRGVAKNPVESYLLETPQKRQEFRLTRYETLIENSKFWEMTIGILSWLIPMLFGFMGIVAVNKKGK